MKNSKRIRIYITIFLLLISGNSFAKNSSSVYAEKGSFDKSLRAWSKASEQISAETDSWLWNYGKSDLLHANGVRDSLLVVPDSAEPEDITIIVWFHGLNGFGQRTFSKRIAPQIDRLADRGVSFALAIPEMPWSINTNTPRGRQGRVWREKGSLEAYISSVKERLSTWARIRHNRDLSTVRVIFVGHSAGGSAIMSASKEGGLCRSSPEHIIWSDATYGTWLSRAWNGCIKHMDRSVEGHIIVRKWDKPHTEANKVLREISSQGPAVLYQVMDRKTWTHGAIGDGIFKIVDVFPPGC